MTYSQVSFLIEMNEIFEISNKPYLYVPILPLLKASGNGGSFYKNRPRNHFMIFKKRGGDIDLFIKSKISMNRKDLLEKKVRFLSKLKSQIGDQKI